MADEVYNELDDRDATAGVKRQRKNEPKYRNKQNKKEQKRKLPVCPVQAADLK